MNEASVRVCFGCLMHDIGKPVLRAGGQTGDHSSLGYAYLKKLWPQDQNILDCVRLHHAAALRAAPPAEDSLAWIACIADNISAAADRRSMDTEESGFRRHLPLAPVFSHMNGEHPGKAVSPVPQTGQLHLPLENMDALTAAQYQTAVDALAPRLAELPRTEQWLNSLLCLLESYLSAFPSSTNTAESPDISLFADTDDAQVRQFLSQCAYQAGRLQSRLFYRNALLQKILLVAAQQQAAYFVGGEKKPLRQKDVAALLGVNVSTISRAIQGKYISVDGRCIRVRELFSRPSAGNRARSTHSIQQQILALIEAEDPQRPLSDQKIHEQLAQSGVAVSRRLIAKYRALAQIPPAYARKITRESTGRNVVSAGGEKE